MMIGRMRTDRERQPVAIHNREDFHAFAAFGEAHGVAAALRGRKGGVDEALTLVERPFFAQRIGQLSKDLTQHLTLTPVLEPAMDGFVIRIALGQQVPLRACVQNPEHRLQDGPRWHGLAARATVRDVLFGESLPNPFPLVITQT